MSNIPAISVVIPLYNKKPCIARALDSILAQTIQDFEIIVVDDGSTDDSASIVVQYSDSRIRLIRQDNQGVSAARNRGIIKARADLIAFLDADDEWKPNFIETVLRMKKMFPDAGIYGTAYEVHFPGKAHFPGTIVDIIYLENEGERILPTYFGALVESRKTIFNSSSFAAPLNVLIDVGGYPLGVKWNEDGTLWGKIALRFPIAYSPTICSTYHQLSINNSTNTNEYLDNPFIRYVSTLPEHFLSHYSDTENLYEYIDFCKLAAISRNINSGHGTQARNELSTITISHYKSYKHKLLLRSYIPPPIFKFIKKNAILYLCIKRKIVGPGFDTRV